VVFKAAEPLAASSRAALIYLDENEGGLINGRPFINANVLSDRFHEVTFAARVGGRGDWTLLGTDDNPGYRVLYDTRGLADGTEVEFQAVAIDHSGRESVSQSVTLVVDREAPAPNVFEQP
jgi:hypothetical protein